MGNEVRLSADPELLLGAAYIPDNLSFLVIEDLTCFVRPDVRRCEEDGLAWSVGGEESAMENCPDTRLPSIGGGERVAAC